MRMLMTMLIPQQPQQQQQQQQQRGKNVRFVWMMFILMGTFATKTSCLAETTRFSIRQGRRRQQQGGQEEPALVGFPGWNSGQSEAPQGDEQVEPPLLPPPQTPSNNDKDKNKNKNKNKNPQQQQQNKQPKPPPPPRGSGRNKPVFGTEQGYDVGGSEPLCWSSSYNASQYTSSDASASDASMFTNHLDELQDYMFTERDKADPVQLLSSCYNGTSLTITPLDLDPSHFDEKSSSSSSSSSEQDDAEDAQESEEAVVMYLERPYTFRLNIDLDLDHLSATPLLDMVQDDAILIYCRLHVCHAEFQGFCNPLIDTRAQEANWTSRADTDVIADDDDHADAAAADEELLFADDNTKWQYEPGTPLKGLVLPPPPESNNNNKKKPKKKPPPAKAVYTRWIQWKLRRQTEDGSNNTNAFAAQVDMTLQLPAGLPDGPYFVVGHVVVDVAVQPQSQLALDASPAAAAAAATTDDSDRAPHDYHLRVDISQTIPDKVVQVRPEPVILTASVTSKVWLSLAIIAVGSVCLYFLWFIWEYRHSTVMKLSQGGLLGAMAVACLVQTVSTSLYLPVQDSFCRFKGPLVHIPLTFVGACMVGRVWRIYSTLAAANALGRKKSSSSSNNSSSSSRNNLARRQQAAEMAFVRCLDGMAGLFICYGRAMPSWCSKLCTNDSTTTTSTRGRRGSAFRRVVTLPETYGLIFLLTLPQVIFQFAASVMLYDGGLETQYDPASGYDIGRVVCAVNIHHPWVHTTGTGIAAVVYAMAVLMARISRDLPTAFNEKDQIFNAAAIATILAVMAIALGAITDKPTTEPDVSVFLWSSVSIGIVVSVLWLIIWPKIRRLKSGEKVVVSSLLGSRYSAGPTAKPYSATDPASDDRLFPETARPSATTTTPSHAASPSTTSNSHAPNGNAVTHRQRTRVRADDPIPGHIETTILDVQGILRNATVQSGDGRPLSKEEWLEMRGEVAKLKAHLDLIDFEPPEEQAAFRNNHDCTSPA